MKLWTLTRPLMPHFISPSSSSSPRLPLYLSLSLCSTNTNNHTVSPLSTSTSACRHVLCLPSLPHSEGPWWSTCLSRTNKSAPGSAPSELLQLPENKHDENSSAQDGQRCSVPPVGGISDGGDELFDAVAKFVHKDICKREKEIKIRQAGRTDVKKGLQDRRGIFMEPGCV